MNYFSIAAGSAIGGIIVSNFGFNAVFLVMATLCFLSAIYIFRLQRRVL
jgi:predicted MFS family arabinose efflux permease